MFTTAKADVSAEASASALELRALSKVKRYMFAYFILGMIFVQLDKTSIGFAQLTMGKDLALKATAFGFAAGIFSFASFLMQVPSSVFFTKFGAKRWLTSAMVIWGGVCIAQAFVTNSTELIVLRFLLGVFEAGFLPALFILVGIWFRSNKHGIAVSCIQIGTAAAGVFGGLFAGWILGHSFFGLAGWRNLFLVEGAATILFALLALLVVSDDPANAPWLKKDEREFMIGYLAAYEAEKLAHGAIEKPRFFDTLKDPRILMLTLSYACAGFATSVATVFTPMLLKTAVHGLSLMTVGILATVPYIVNVIVAFFWGAHADKHNERHWHTVMPIVVGLIGVLLYTVVRTPAAALLALVLAHAGNTGVYVNFWATCTMVVGRKTIAQSTAIINSGSALSTFVGPTIFGWAMDTTGSSNAGLYICGGVLLLNFMILNVFFFAYKAQQRARAD